LFLIIFGGSVIAFQFNTFSVVFPVCNVFVFYTAPQNPLGVAVNCQLLLLHGVESQVRVVDGYLNGDYVLKRAAHCPFKQG
jgi:hypothetical protein